MTSYQPSRISHVQVCPTDSDIDLNAYSPTRIAERVIVLEGWRAALLAVFAGAMSALAIAPYHFFPVLFVTLPILVWLLDGAVPPAGSAGFLGIFRRFWPAFRTGWLFGFGYFLAGLWWIGKAFLVDADEFIYLLPLAVLALPAGLALFWGAAAALSRLAWSEGWVRIAALAASFTLAEWLRGTVLTGFPWNTLGYAFMPTPLLMQTSALIGLYGVTFITIFVAAVPGLFTPGRSRSPWPALAAAAILMVAHVGYGLFALSRASDATVEKINIRIVQPAIDQNEKWDQANEAEIMSRYFDLSNANRGPEAASIGAFTHVIWPESAFPFVLTERRDQLAAIANLLPPATTLITGAMRLEKASGAGERHKVFNALYVINGEGEIVVARDKTHLVPFGEFLPFQQTLEDMGFQQLTKIRGGFAAGNRRQTVSTPTTPSFLPLICYEIIFSGSLIGDAGEDFVRPQWMVNLTNDAWYGMTAGPYQHAHQAQVRAVEEGIPVVRAANNGISMVVDANGRIRESLGLGERGVVDARLPVAGPATLFSQYGNFPVLVFVCALFLILIGVKTINTNRL